MAASNGGGEEEDLTIEDKKTSAVEAVQKRIRAANKKLVSTPLSPALPCYGSVVGAEGDGRGEGRTHARTHATSCRLGWSRCTGVKEGGRRQPCTLST